MTSVLTTAAVMLSVRIAVIATAIQTLVVIVMIHLKNKISNTSFNGFIQDKIQYETIILFNQIKKMEKKICQITDNYRLCKFVVVAKVQEGWMLYNTTTGGVIYIKSSDDLYQSLDKLVEMHYYVPLEFDEVEWVNNIRTKKIQKQKNGLIDGLTILTTMDCNARCFYCYEKGQPRISMTDTIAQDVANFIIQQSPKSSIKLRWFGGEPLVNTNAINIICNSLIDNGVEFKSSMISNGLLFTDSIILQAQNVWKLKNVQITLDGTKEVYQKAKAYKNANGDEFDTVINNIKKISEANIKVSIRLNQGLYNTSDLLELIDFLATKFKGNKLVSIYNSLLYEEQDNHADQEMYDKFQMVQNKIMKCGFFRGNPLKRKLKTTHCMADNDSSVIITPKGDIGKCEHYTNQYLVGNIYDKTIDANEIKKCKEQYLPTQKCFECPLYPQCVRIKLCPEEKEFCSFTECENKIELIRRALIKKYKTQIVPQVVG